MTGLDAVSLRILHSLMGEIGCKRHDSEYALVPYDILHKLLILACEAMPDDDDEIGEPMGEA